jgi:hypothetical protein
MFRGTPRAFATDPKALAWAMELIVGDPWLFFGGGNLLGI